ncbi:MAG: TolC family protein [Bacteroidales bacterium]|jgi:outer membrane protein TolC|nr:TolC family protein [Bacteroidales bacterium]
MKKNKALIGLILLVIGFTSSKISFSQDTIENQIVLKDFSSLILPPIDSLFLSLENNPNIKAHDYRLLEQESILKSQKREWINYLRFSSSYQYGYQGAESLVQGFLIPAYYQTSENAQNLYHVGVSLTIPFGDVIDRGNKVKKEKIRLGQIQAEKEISINEQKFIIIELYNKANEQLNTYKNIAEAKSYAELKTRIIQKDFINGIINIDELTDAKKSESDIISNYEKAKSELMVALMKLEIICNYKFHIIKQL